MKHPGRKILALILTSNLLLFVVVSSVFNLAIPTHFKKDAVKTLNNEIIYINGNKNTDYSSTYLTRNISYIYLSEKEKTDSPENAQKSDYLQNYKNVMSIEESEIRNYCFDHTLDYEACYYFETKNGFYIFSLFELPYMNDLNLSDDNDSNALIMYINIEPFIQYAYSWNWILLFLFIGVSLVMGGIGYILSKQIEESQNSERRFFQNSSHELKTPLMAIQGYAESIQSGIGDPVASASVIMQEGERMAKLVEELLSISKIDAHQMKLHKNLTDIREVLYDCLRIAEPIAVSNHVQLTPEFIDKPVRINCDEEQMTRAFLNVIVNGLHHCKSSITVYCEVQSDTVIIKICDDGQGISKEDLPHVFERFYTGHKGGSGIGLSLAAEIIHLHKGKITVYNNDTGATFEIHLPMS